jgi:hypothetical protein
LPIIWIGTFLILFGFYLDGGREHRYMLPAYPAFAVASAYISWRLSNRLDEMTGFRWGSLALVLILVGSTFWSTSIGLDAVFGGGGLIKVPF